MYGTMTECLHGFTSVTVSWIMHLCKRYTPSQKWRHYLNHFPLLLLFCEGVSIWENGKEVSSSINNRLNLFPVMFSTIHRSQMLTVYDGTVNGFKTEELILILPLPVEWYIITVISILLILLTSFLCRDGTIKNRFTVEHFTHSRAFHINTIYTCE